MTQTSAAQRGREPTTDKNAIRPFYVNVPEAELTEMRRRINATRWPEKETVADFSQGVPLATMQKLARYWTTEYDWRKVEAKLNSYPQFITNIDGLDIHFIHVRSKEKNALPVIVTHGWPGSIIEQLKIVDPLVDPTAYGGSASDAFDVVIPSMPGYGYSGKPTMTGWDHARIARAWAVLMKRLGYTRYVAQGGDWGAIINDVMATQGHPELIGMHTNLPAVIPPEINKAAAAGSPPPASLSAEEKRAYETIVLLYKTIPTQFFMASHPQTLYGIADSPIGVASWLLDHDPISLRLIARAFDGEATGLTRDDVLDNVTLFWLTNTTISASRLYWEGFAKADLGPKNVSIPVAVSVFPDEQYHTPRSWAERAYPKLIHYNQLEKGGHFAAWEQPKLLVDEMRVGLKSLRQQEGVMRKFSRDEEAIRKLSPEQYRVTQQAATERPGSGEYLYNKEPGIYVDIVSGEPLFASSNKFDSRSGWPSFTKPIDPANVNERPDAKEGGIEVRSAHGDSHLGHVFPDGPQDRGGMRYCINSAALRFIHRDDMEAEGYAAYLNQVEEVR